MGHNMRRPDDLSMRNPMLEYPRNLPCPCQSGKKFKKCCYLTMPEYVRKGDGKEEAAAKILAYKRAYKRAMK